ncbi:WecB/TagA/CpsF family glycosyltransferase [Thalassomonas viridans]|uniref:WecB/TagA/CpsF family glycosyltransferase n=1 Tax=Thalassomonas viridans TaxID=137584 RepID=A0AAE9Z2B7_9GAMM|nr:WecB/TagA/CpsF family glycosyltransferase [Thalassomonas viridans]WDE03938.1 WecB/TagA/CpsF family glycosyltransferase [Thalassomonas viridans]
MTDMNITPVEIAGVKVHPFASVGELLNCVFSSDGEIRPGMAVAVNPEKVLKSLEDEETKAILNEATITYADGVGVVKALERKLDRKLVKIAGCELWLDVLNRSKDYHSKVLLVGARAEVVEKSAEILLNRGINVVHYMDGYFSDEQVVINAIEKHEAQIVIVAQGSPRQEKLIKRLQQIHPKVFYMGVGGSFDVLAGHVKRAPALWVKCNVEWLYRLLAEPKRVFRQFKLFKYVYLYMLNRL